MKGGKPLINFMIAKGGPGVMDALAKGKGQELLGQLRAAWSAQLWFELFLWCQCFLYFVQRPCICSVL